MTSLEVNGGRTCKTGRLLAVALVVMTTATVLGLDIEARRETLRGLTGVEVVVEDVLPEIEQAGLSRSQLQTDTELRLRKAGIRVLTQEERITMPGAPWLYINVTGYRVDRRDGFPLGYAAFSQVSLRQRAWLARDPDITAYGAETWSSTGILETG